MFTLARLMTPAIALIFAATALQGCAPEPSEENTSETPAPISLEESETDTTPPEGSEVKAEEAVVEESVQGAPDYDTGDLLEGLSPEGWKPSGPIEHYNVATLYNKINGRSELYMSYNVRGLSWVDLVQDEDQGRFIDVFIYDMRDATGAFGTYAVEREIDQPSAGLGREAYVSDGNHYFWKGKWYAYVQSSHDDEEGRAAGYAVAKALVDRLEDSGEAVRGLDWLPEDGLVRDSITYFLVDAMSLDFMTDTFMAKYEMGSGRVTCFITKRDSEEAAAKIVEEYGTYMEDYGEAGEHYDIDGIDVVIADLGGGYYDAIFHYGVTAAGVSAVKGKEETQSAAKAFVGRVINAAK